VLGDMGLGLTAAVEGGGVAIARSLLVADAIGDGRLIPALATAPDVRSTKVHIARWRAELVGDRNANVLVSWLTQAAEQTSREVAGSMLQ
jgi:LysR family transcriptional regulator, glycine cleavage system transcriptional activator